MSKPDIKLKATRFAVMALVLGLSGSVMADAARHEYSESDSTFAYGKVIDVTPIYREVKVSTPVKECWSEPVTRSRQVYHRGNTAGSTLAGGLIGGIIGHQFGGGSGKKLATAVGTIVGAQIGHDAAHGAYGVDDTYIAYEDVCEVEHKVSYERELEGYRVNYRYQGNQYQSILPYDPGKRVKLRVSIEPVY